MSNSAHDHRTSGKRQPRAKRETSMARGACQRGRQAIDFRSRKIVMDRDRAA